MMLHWGRLTLEAMGSPCSWTTKELEGNRTGHRAYNLPSGAQEIVRKLLPARRDPSACAQSEATYLAESLEIARRSLDEEMLLFDPCAFSPPRL